MLEKTPDHADDPDILADVRQARPYAADTANDQIDDEKTAKVLSFIKDLLVNMMADIAPANDVG